MSEGKKLNFRYGAMDSGKSLALLSTAHNYESRGLDVLIAKPAVDTKGDDTIVSRVGLSRRVDFLITPEMDVREEVRRVMGERAFTALAAFITDESQFLTPEQVDGLFEITKRDGISVVAFGLKADFRARLFPGSQRLFELADDIKELPTMCSCGQQARFNARKIDGEFVFEGSQVAIDGVGDVTYESICGSCYLKERDKVAQIALSQVPDGDILDSIERGAQG